MTRDQAGLRARLPHQRQRMHEILCPEIDHKSMTDDLTEGHILHIGLPMSKSEIDMMPERVDRLR